MPKLKTSTWFEIILGFTLLTLLAVLFIPGNSFYAYLRYVLGFVYVGFLPGYCLVNLLFTKKDNIDFVEELVLSIALSFGLDGLAGLFLGLSPIGINFNSILISLSALVLVLGTAAFIRKTRISSMSSMQSSSQEDSKTTSALIFGN